jgi:hypothetical protein
MTTCCPGVKLGHPFSMGCKNGGLVLEGWGLDMGLITLHSFISNHTVSESMLHKDVVQLMSTDT